VSLKGGDKHIRRLKKLSGDAVVRIASAVVLNGAEAIKAEAHNSITRNSAAGQSGGKHQHVRSRPGEPPNNEFGTLVSHIEASQPKPLVAEVRSEAPYAAHLEFGTSRMQARPYMRPARDAKLPEIKSKLTEKLEKLVKASGE
jgi:HK97 gp10 family phage protein